jgi:hypothetical protein
MDDSVDDILSVLKQQAQKPPESGQVTIATHVQTRKGIELTLWRTLFLFGAIYIGLLTLQIVWACSIGGMRGLQGWVMRITSTSPEDGPVKGWIVMSVISGFVFAGTIVAWLLQSRTARDLLRTKPN